MPAPTLAGSRDIVCGNGTVGLGNLTDDRRPPAGAINYLKGDLWLIQRESRGVYRLCS